MLENIQESLFHLRQHILEGESAKQAAKISTVSAEVRRSELIKKIEEVVLKVISNIANREPLELEYYSADWKNVNFSDRIEMKEEVACSKVKLIHKPSRPKLLLMIQLLEKAFQLLTSGSTATQRELYYQLLHGNKNTVSATIQNVCSMLSCAPWELGILSTSKGLVAGPVTIELPEEIIDCSTQGGVQVPSNMFQAVNAKSEAKFVLVVEKDAIFQKLLDEETLKRLGPCILMTGKGFPDVCTRQLLRFLWDNLHIPILALVDADPHGIEIMCVYRFGSVNMSDQAQTLAVPALRWLGIHPTDIERLGFSPQSLAPMSKNDRSKANDLLKRPYITNSPRLKREVEKLIQLDKKAEIEAVGNFSQAYLTDVFIPNKISNQEFY